MSFSARSFRKGAGESAKAHNVFVQAGKDRFRMEEVCPCCNGGYDGAINKPVFNASGDRFVAKKSMTAFFSRGGGSVFKCGKTKRVDRRAGAVHSVEEAKTRTAVYKGSAKGGETRVAGEYRAGFKPSGKASGLFSRPGTLGPSDVPAVQVDPRAGGGFKAGKYVRPAEPTAPRVPSPIETKRSPRRAVRPFKGASVPGDFFKSSYYMAEAGGEAAQVKQRLQRSGKWRPGGKGDRPFGRYPDHLPDPYSGSHVRFQKEGMFYGKDGCMERAVKGPQMYVCLCWSRATPPVEWGADKVKDMYAKRVASKGNFVYSVMPVNQVPLSMSQRVGKPIAVK